MILAYQIESDTLILRVPRPGDGEMLYDALSDMLEVLRKRPNTWGWANEEQNATKSEQYCLRSYYQWKLNIKWPLIIIDKQTNKVAGVIEFYFRDWGWEVGVWSRPIRKIDSTLSNFNIGEGIMIEAWYALIDYMLEHGPDSNIQFGIETSNKAALLLSKRLGGKHLYREVNSDRNNSTFEIFQITKEEVRGRIQNHIRRDSEHS